MVGKVYETVIIRSSTSGNNAVVTMLETVALCAAFQPHLQHRSVDNASRRLSGSVKTLIQILDAQSLASL